MLSFRDVDIASKVKAYEVSRLVGNDSLGHLEYGIFLLDLDALRLQHIM
jgi:hypothetical protein